MRVSPGARRYFVQVTTLPRGDRWGVSLALAGEDGVILNRANVSDLVFETRAGAEAAGWRVADEWIARLTGRNDGDDARPLAPEERALLIGCEHPIARCAGCGLHQNFFELRAERYCARCRADLATLIRPHLRECGQILIRRAAATAEASESGLKENRRIQDAGGVTRAEADTIRAEAKRTRARKATPGGSVCRLCDRPVIPGHAVSFRHGALVHLECYERRRTA